MITSLQGAGLGLRRALLPELLSMDAGAVDFLECAPDNWIGVGGSYGNALATLAERYPLSCHGLSLSLGGPMPLDHAFLRRTRELLDRQAGLHEFRDNRVMVHLKGEVEHRRDGDNQRDMSCAITAGRAFRRMRTASLAMSLKAMALKISAKPSGYQEPKGMRL